MGPKWGYSPALKGCGPWESPPAEVWLGKDVWMETLISTLGEDTIRVQQINPGGQPMRVEDILWLVLPYVSLSWIQTGDTWEVSGSYHHPLYP